MSQITPVVAVLEALRIVMADVAGLPRRVQIRTALPLLDQLTQHGYPLAALSDELQKARLDLKPKALSQALVRWRREQLEKGNPLAEVLGKAAAVPAIRPAATASSTPMEAAPAGEPGSAPLTKVRLKQIREQLIDSSKLERAYRESRSAKSNE